MTGDYTRTTFRPERSFASVRLQQGRVQLDADWNEAADIGLHRDRTTTLDVVGPTGVPEDAPGFGLSPADPDGADSATDLLIGVGRAYVGGILVEYTEASPTVLTPVGGAPGNFLVTAGRVPRQGQWLVGEAGSGLDPALVTEVPDSVEADGGLVRVVLAPVPAGDPVTMRLQASLLAQPDLDGDPVPAAAGTYLCYLEVAEREITALDDPHLRETGLGGPDTCLRSQVVWRVRSVGGATCHDFPPGWHPDPAARARLLAEGVPATADDDPCLTPDPGGYRGIDNRLFRVEVHRGGDMASGDVLVKWSRDNAIHRTRFITVADRLAVESLGKDDVVALDQEQWVELQDEAAWRAGRSGLMVRLGEVNGLEIAVAEIRDAETNDPLTDGDGDPLVAALPAAGLLRRWEGGVPVAIAADTPLALESGVQVTIGIGELRPGEAWLIPARTLVADVEWPTDPATGNALAIPPQTGGSRAMALAVVERLASGRLAVVSDCRPFFAPLTRQIAFQMLGGDGQEALVGLVAGAEANLVPLAQPLRVGVARGRSGVPGRRVRFRTLDATNPAALEPVPGTPPDRVLVNTPAEVVIVTDEDGVADVRCSVHGQRMAYAMEARLLDADEPAIADAIHLPIRFFAAAEVAAEVAYDPAGCLYQSQTPGADGASTTVQEAIDRLCPPILMLPLGGDGQMAFPGEPLGVQLRVGLIWGSRPLANVRVRFDLASGSAAVAPAVVNTDAAGIASTTVNAGQNPQLDQGVIRVRVSAEGLAQPSWPPELLMNARFARGGGVERPSIRIDAILRTNVAGAQELLRVGDLLSIESLSQGFELRVDAPVDPVMVEVGMAGEVWLDVPTTAIGTLQINLGNTSIRYLPGGIAFRPDGRLFVDGDRLFWRFDEAALQWLRAILPGQLETMRRPIISARFVVHGGLVFAPNGREQWLDGGLRVEADGRTPVRPGGVDVPGSALVFPFRVGTQQGGVGPNDRFILVPVADTRVVGNLDTPGRLLLGRALDASIDRSALVARNLVAAERLTAMQPAQPVRVAIEREALAAVVTQPLRVLVRNTDRELFEQVREQIQEQARLRVEPVFTRATTADTFARQLSADDAPDLAFADAAFLDEVRQSNALSRQLGTPLVEL